MTSTHRVPPFHSWNRLLTLLSCVLQSDIWEHFEGYGEKGNILRSKLERSLLRKCISMCECNSQSYTFSSVFSLLTEFSGNLRRNYLDRMEEYADKGNIIRSIHERSFLRNFSVICEFHSQSYSWVLRKQFANTLFMESAKWDMGAHRGPWW